jgi:hypothetical protein
MKKTGASGRPLEIWINTPSVDATTLDEIIKVLEIKPEHAGWFAENFCKSVLATRGLVARPEFPFDGAEDTIARLDQLIAALKYLAGDSRALAFFLKTCWSTVVKENFPGALRDECVAQVTAMVEQLQRERESIARYVRRGRGSPRGTRAPGLDLFLALLLDFGEKCEAKLSAYKDRENGSARGTIVEVLRLVAPYFDKNFSPASDATLLKAISRAREPHALRNAFRSRHQLG